jgi:hypothetical protein
MSSLQQNWRKGQNRFFLEVSGVRGRGKGWGAGGEIAPTMYAHMNKEEKYNVKINPTCFFKNSTRKFKMSLRIHISIGQHFSTIS